MMRFREEEGIFGSILTFLKMRTIVLSFFYLLSLSEAFLARGPARSMVSASTFMPHEPQLSRQRPSNRLAELTD